MSDNLRSTARWALGVAALALTACGEEDLRGITDPPVEEPETVVEEEPVEEPEEEVVEEEPVEEPPAECIETTSVVGSDNDFSTFQVGYSLAGVTGIDGMVIDSPRPATLAANERWTIGSIEVLVVRPTQAFSGKLNDTATDYQLSIDLWDGADPTAKDVRHWTQSVTVAKSALTWEAHDKAMALNFGPDASCDMDYECEDQPGGNCDAFVGKCVYASRIEKAWLTFDLAKTLGGENLTSPQLTVGVHWTRPDSPLVAGSEYDKSCYLNWNRKDPDGKEGTLARISTDEKKKNCNWPLVRVRGQTVKTVQQGEACE